MSLTAVNADDGMVGVRGNPDESECRKRHDWCVSCCAESYLARGLGLGLTCSRAQDGGGAQNGAPCQPPQVGHPPGL